MMTDLILKIGGIDRALSVEFYVERERCVKFLKDDLIHIYRNGSMEYYAPLCADKLGRGHLMACVEFEDKEPALPSGNRRVVVNGFTGYSIPCLGEGNTIACGDYEVSFERVSDIPEGYGLIYYGIIEDEIKNYDEITQDMIKGLEAIKPETLEITLAVSIGNKVVVAVPRSAGLRPCKKIMGEEVDFSAEIMGACGSGIKIDEIDYYLWGEFFITPADLLIYIR